MQTWAKRGIQTALVTGGLLMLGTGIASADEDVNPDRPASPLDASVSVPLKIDNNAVGTPLGQLDTPTLDHEVEVIPADVTGDLSASALDVAGPILGLDDEPLLGNRIAGDLVVPVDISGNAIAALGNAEVENTSSQSLELSRPQDTNGTGGTLAGNVVDLDYALPVQIAGNAVSGLGNAESTNTATQKGAAVGDVNTDGTNGTLSGNVLAPQGATPVQITGNAVSGAGTAEADSTATSEGWAGGSLFTNGRGGFGSGNAGGVPLALPVEVNNNAVGGAAIAEAEGSNTAAAFAGDTSPGFGDRPTYIQTYGDPSMVSGNLAQPALAGPASVNCNAGAVLAESEAGECTSTTRATAGGINQTNGTGSLLSGTAAQAPVALPAEVFGNAAAGGGTAEAIQDNEVASDAGGGSYTFGDQSTGGGSVVMTPVAGPVDVFSNAAAGAGEAVADNQNDITTQAGEGFSGTMGDNSTGGGNVAVAPVALPLEGFGNVGGAVGTATSTASETKVTNAGGDTSTDDDGGLLAANLAQAALSGPVQIIGNGVGGAGNTTSHVEETNNVVAGGDTTAQGTGGTLAGNIGQVPVSLPAQLMGSNATAAGIGNASGVVDTTSSAGGDAQTDGVGGFGTGNVVSGSLGSVAQLFGDSVAALGLSVADTDSTTDSSAGGNVATSGAGGGIAGNVVTAQALPFVQGFGDALSAVGGVNSASADNVTSATSGGGVATNGDGGTISGNLADVPAAAIVQAFGDAVAVFGSDSKAAATNQSAGSAGGATTTSGANGSLSGLDATVPVGAAATLWDVPLEVLANAFADATNQSVFTTGETAPLVDLPISGESMGGLPITDMPRLPELPELSTPARKELPPPGDGPLGGLTGSFGPVTGVLGPVTGLLGGLPIGGLTGGLPTGGLPTGGLTGGLPTGGLTGGLPTGDLTGGLPTGDLTGGLPIGGATGGDVTDGLDEVPGAGMVGAVPGLAGVLPGLSAVSHMPTLPGAVHTMPVSQSRLDTPALPGLPKVPGLGDLAGLSVLGELIDTLLSGGLPAVPSLPGVPGATGTPGVAGLPGLPQLPGVPGVDAVPGLPDVTEAPTLQAPSLGTLPVKAPALSGLDTDGLLDLADLADSASLADTKSQLAGLFAHHPIG